MSSRSRRPSITSFGCAHHLSLLARTHNDPRSLHVIHDDAKDKLYEFEVTWICKQSNYQHARVPEAILEEANRIAQNELNPPDEME